MDQNFPWFKINHKVFKKSIWSILNSIIFVQPFKNLFGNYYEINYNLENWISWEKILRLSPGAESVKGCCAEFIFGPKHSVDQNKSQGIQKVDLEHFKFNYHCSTFYKFFRQLLLVSCKNFQCCGRWKKFQFQVVHFASNFDTEFSCNWWRHSNCRTNL